MDDFTAVQENSVEKQISEERVKMIEAFNRNACLSVRKSDVTLIDPEKVEFSSNIEEEKDGSLKVNLSTDIRGTINNAKSNLEMKVLLIGQKAH